MAIDFDTLRIANNMRQKFWDPEGKLTAGFHALETGGETGEVLMAALSLAFDIIRVGGASGEMLNKWKKIERERLGLAGSRTTVEDFADELADLVICADLVAGKIGIDLAEAVQRKFNSVSRKLNIGVEIDGEGNIIAGIEDLEDKGGPAQVLPLEAASGGNSGSFGRRFHEGFSGGIQEPARGGNSGAFGSVASGLSNACDQEEGA